MNAAAPDEAHSRRLAELNGRVAALSRSDRRLSHARLAVFAGGAIAAGFAFGPDAIAPAWLMPFAVAFVALVVAHERVIRARRDATEAAAFHEAALARVRHQPPPHAERGDAFADPSHPYAADLDLFGEGSLFEWLCRARTHAGQHRLAEWLLSPAPPEAWPSRQQAARELAARVDLRERLWVEAAAARSGVDSAVLAAWADAPPAGLGTPQRVLAGAAVAVAVAATVAALAGALQGGALAAVLAAEALVAQSLARRVRTVIAGVEAAAAPLASLRRLLAVIEREHFEAPALVALQRRLGTGGDRPSARLDSLSRRLDLLESRRNLLVAVPAALLLWGTQLAGAIEAWRGAQRTHVRDWLDAAADVEALASIAAVAWEHPDDAWPEPLTGPPRVAFEQLGHPLLPQGGVRNDLALGPPALLVVSGSNMAGKSTLLRAAGVAIVLAQAGAPVRAARAALTPLALGATLRVQDSLQGGRSRFYAELLKLRQLLAMAERTPPLLFLLDEILHGTNSHDREVGAAAVLGRLLAAGAIGIVTTHDLALARLVRTPGWHAVNAHFADDHQDGAMVFDYRLRPGPVTRGNALALMRSLGLADDGDA